MGRKHKIHLGHFKYLNDIVIDENELLDIIRFIKPNTHDVKPLILELSSGVELNLRLEILNSSFILELFNVGNTLADIISLKKILNSFPSITGIMLTVVPTQFNFIFIGQGWDHDKLPPEFIRIDF